MVLGSSSGGPATHAAAADASGAVDELKEDAKRLFTKSELGQYWNDLYAEVRNCRDYHFVQRLAVVSSLIAREFGRDIRVLDLGCGAGVLTERLVQEGFTVDAADISADMLEFAAARLARYDSQRARFVRAECSALPFADATFDVVACIGVFGYMDDVDAAIREIRRVLKPGGTLVMSIRNLDHVTVFDFFSWMKVPFVTLPKAVWQRVAPRLRPTPGAPGAPGETGARARHAIQIYDRPRRVARIFESFGFRLRGFDGAGYGPPTFRGKSLVTEDAAKALSAAFSRAVRAVHAHEYAKWVADISVFVFTLDR